MTGLEIALLVGAASSVATGVIGMYQSNQQARAAARAKRKAEDQAVKNQNRLVEEGFNKRRSAMGLGMQGAQQKTGLTASQTGSVLTSVTNGNEASGL